jgi:hypothetical protein
MRLAGMRFSELHINATKFRQRPRGGNIDLSVDFRAADSGKDMFSLRVTLCYRQQPERLVIYLMVPFFGKIKVMDGAIM